MAEKSSKIIFMKLAFSPISNSEYIGCSKFKENKEKSAF
jgi:hypothetical protein